MAVTYSPVYREVFDFLASGPSPDAIIAFRPSPETDSRLRHLLARSQAGTLTDDERAELDEFEQVEHFVRMLKIHTQQKLEE